MSAITKILAGTMVGAGVITGINFIKRLRKAQAAMEIIPTANIYSLSWDAVTIRVDVLIKNPTSGSFSIKFPFVKIIYKDNTVGSSQAVNRNIKIAAYGETRIEKIMVRIPVLSVFSVVYALIKSFHNNEPVALKIITTTVADIGISNVPYESETTVIVKKPQNILPHLLQ